MKKSLLGLIMLFILLSTYKPNFSIISNLNLNVKDISIENTFILDDDEIKKKINFLYDENLLFLDLDKIKQYLKQETFIESYSLKRIYPSTLKITITEKKPIAILQNKKKKFYISDKGDLINFQNLSKFEHLPTVFGTGKNFYSLYLDLQKIKFPIEMIKSYYFFESDRWDLILHNKKIIKLPTKNYLISLKNFMSSKNNMNFNNYKIFDYRIKDQLILN